ncbi:very short patch repair endonuclease [Nocardia fluminea]|nr:DNA mismatch endonuclease Vsr [Nocardia fluminea]
MRANRRRDTGPELALRSSLRALGLGYRVDARPLPELGRRADIVFIGARVAVFCDGCYWHGCPEHYRPARANSAFWSSKIDGNRARDRDTDDRLTDAGWIAIRVWEHEDPHDAADRIADVVVARRMAFRSATPSRDELRDARQLSGQD